MFSSKFKRLKLKTSQLILFSNNFNQIQKLDTIFQIAGFSRLKLAKSIKD